MTLLLLSLFLLYNMAIVKFLNWGQSSVIFGKAVFHNRLVTNKTPTNGSVSLFTCVSMAKRQQCFYNPPEI